MKNKFITIPLIPGLILLVLLQGCKTREAALTTNYTNVPASPEAAGKMIYENNTKYTGLVLKNFKVKYTTQDASTTFYGSAKILKDSLILASLRAPLGLEISRVLLSPDSVKVIDRTEKKFISSDYSYLTSLLHVKVDFPIVESLLSGNLPEDYQYNSRAKASVADSAILSENSVYLGHYYSKKNSNVLKFEAWGTPQIKKASRIKFYKKRNFKLFDVSLEEYQKEEHDYYPGEIAIHHKNSRGINTRIRVIFNKFEKTKDTSINFNIPDEYRKIRMN